MENPFAPEILVEAHGPVRVVKMNRPEQLNAVNARLHHGLARVWRFVAEDPEARAVVFTGEGRGFSAGGDMAFLQELRGNPARRRASLEEAAMIVTEMIDCPLPIVGAVNGPAVGLGCSVAVLCDIVYIAESAYIADPHVGVGLTAGDGGAPAWPLLAMLLKAKEYLLTGERISPQEAVAMGLANRVVPDAELMERAMALAEKLAKQPQQAIRTTKKAINMHLARGVRGPLEYALAAEYHSFDTPEHGDFVDKFLNR